MSSEEEEFRAAYHRAHGEGYLEQLASAANYDIALMYETHGLGQRPSLEEIRPVAERLIVEGRLNEAFSLALGRHVDIKEEGELSPIGVIAHFAQEDPQKAFMMLLVEREIDD